jgi:tetratricopeptide (TPR) repeat protein
MASALLAFAAAQGAPPEEVAGSWRTVNEIAKRVSEQRPRPGQDVIDLVNKVVFEELGYAREITSTDSRFLLLPSVVAGRRGGCLGLGALYLALGERLGIPIGGVLVPGHFFVRVLEPRARNVELLRQGEAMPDDWYRGKYGPWAETASAYMRPLAIPEVIAVHWFNVGNQRHSLGDLAGAADAYTRAARDFPSFAEASASIGTVHHRTGDLQSAALSYRAAARARPDLPGLAHNLSVLEAERSARQPLPGPPPNREQPQSGEIPQRSLP